MAWWIEFGLAVGSPKLVESGLRSLNEEGRRGTLDRYLAQRILAQPNAVGMIEAVCRVTCPDQAKEHHCSWVKHTMLDGKTLLHCAAERGDHVAIRLLLNRGADRNAIWRGKTALQIVQDMQKAFEALSALSQSEQYRDCVLALSEM